MWTVANLAERFSDRYDFHIVTRNYDSKGDTRPYETVATGEWNTVGPARVFYCAKTWLTLSRVADLVREVKPDLVFLNSAFSMPARQFLRTRRAGKMPPVPVVLAPCGEMSRAAMSVKPLKKALFLKVALRADLFRNVVWKGSSNSEAEDIRQVVGHGPSVLVAPDLTPRAILPDYDAEQKPLKESGRARIAFMSRVVPNKNLKYLLRSLMSVRGELLLDVIGPIEDRAYWKECQRLIRRLPTNIQVTFTGPLPQTEALSRLVENHFFVLPSQTENFGYVVIEALSAGCPLIISDRTSWDEIESVGAGWSVGLDRPDEWVSHLESCIEMDTASYRVMSEKARRHAVSWLETGVHERQNAHVLAYALLRTACPANSAAA